jgi:translation initiation factor IF-3
LRKRIFINNRIKARKVRVIDNEGNQLGIFDLNQALEKAHQKGLDLIQITDKVEPPICKITDYGKFLYALKKKEKQHKQKTSELKNIRLSFNISTHDMETRAKSAEKFLRKGHKVRIEMRLKGREKALLSFAKDKLNNFLGSLKEQIPIKVEKEIKRETRGLTTIIAKE